MRLRGDVVTKYRYASTMGDRYAMPIYFPTLADAQAHQRKCAKLLGGLPGQDSMQVQAWRDGEWQRAEVKS